MSKARITHNYYPLNVCTTTCSRRCCRRRAVTFSETVYAHFRIAYTGEQFVFNSNDVGFKGDTYTVVRKKIFCYFYLFSTIDHKRYCQHVITVIHFCRFFLIIIFVSLQMKIALFFDRIIDLNNKMPALKSPLNTIYFTIRNALCVHRFFFVTKILMFKLLYLYVFDYQILYLKRVYLIFHSLLKII